MKPVLPALASGAILARLVPGGFRSRLIKVNQGESDPIRLQNTKTKHSRLNLSLVTTAVAGLTLLA
jgi:hypothetical protein